MVLLWPYRLTALENVNQGLCIVIIYSYKKWSIACSNQTAALLPLAGKKISIIFWITQVSAFSLNHSPTWPWAEFMDGECGCTFATRLTTNVWCHSLGVFGSMKTRLARFNQWLGEIYHFLWLLPHYQQHHAWMKANRRVDWILREPASHDGNIWI